MTNFEPLTLEELQSVRTRAERQWGALGWTVADMLVEMLLGLPRESMEVNAKRTVELVAHRETRKQRDSREYRQWLAEEQATA